MKKHLFSYSDEDVRKMVLRCYGRLKGYLRNVFTMSAQEADDALQEALCRILASKAEVEEDRIDGYFFRTVKNICINDRTRRPKTVSLEKMETETAWDFIAAVDFEDAEVSMTADKDISRILDYANQFSPRTRDIFNMRRIDGMSTEEIAEKLGISVRAVEKHLQKSVQMYRREFLKFS